MQVQPAQQALKAGGGAVLLHGGVLGDSGLAGVFAAAQHGGLGVGQHRLDDVQLQILRVGADVMRRHGMQTIGLQARRAHQAGADEQLQHGVAHKGQRQRRHFVNVDFGFLCKQHIFYYLVQIIEFVLADLDRVFFLNALGDQLVQNARITQLRLEILQALVVLDVRTG